MSRYRSVVQGNTIRTLSDDEANDLLRKVKLQTKGNVINGHIIPEDWNIEGMTVTGYPSSIRIKRNGRWYQFDPKLGESTEWTSWQPINTNLGECITCGDTNVRFQERNNRSRQYCSQECARILP